MLTLAAGLVSGCAPGEAASSANSYGVRIDANTPAGMRAQQTMDMLNSDWPIADEGVATMAVEAQVSAISDVMDTMWWDRPITVTAAEVGQDVATLHVSSWYGAERDITLRTDAEGMVTEFDAARVEPIVDNWADLDAVLATTSARYSYQVSRVDDGRCDRVAGANTAQSLPLASIFKLYVLYAVADAVRSGSLRWEDRLTVTDEVKALGSSKLEDLPEGSTVSVRTAADEMISTSDNMATDLLIGRIGTKAVEQALVDAGHHDPASMTPFPTMHELFSVGWGTPDVHEQWVQATPEGRAELLQQTNSRPYQPDPQRITVPASAYGLEWYGSAEDICRVHAALQEMAVGPAAPVRDIMSIIPGVDLPPEQFPYVGAKAGNLPGDLTFSWYVEDSHRQPWVVSLQLNWPRFQGPNTAGWIHSIASQMFWLILKEG